MPLLKPFRINNACQFRPLALIQQHLSYTFLSTLKDCNGLYELRVYVPHVKEVNFSVFIEDHILNLDMHENAAHVAKETDNGMHIFLPSDVNEEMVNAHIKPYGIKIILPKRAVKKSGIKIQVPVLACR